MPRRFFPLRSSGWSQTDTYAHAVTHAHSGPRTRPHTDTDTREVGQGTALPPWIVAATEVSGTLGGFCARFRLSFPTHQRGKQLGAVPLAEVDLCPDAILSVPLAWVMSDLWEGETGHRSTLSKASAPWGAPSPPPTSLCHSVALPGLTLGDRQDGAGLAPRVTPCKIMLSPLNHLPGLPVILLMSLYRHSEDCGS